MEGQEVGELTDGSGVSGGDEEDGSKELRDERGGVGVLRRNLSSLLYLFSHFLRARETQHWACYMSNLTSDTVGFSQGFQNGNVCLLFSPAYHLLLGFPVSSSHLSQPQFAPCLCSLRYFIRRVLASLGIQSPAASSIIRRP